MQKNRLGILLFFMFGCVSFNASSESVGRTEFELPNPGWTLVTTFTTELKFTVGSGINYTLPLENKVFQLPSDGGTPRALLVITSTEYSRRNSHWVTERCPQPKSKYFTQDFGTNQLTQRRECIVVNSSFGPFNYFKPDSNVMKGVNEKGLKLFKSGYSLRSVYGGNSGAYLQVNLMTLKGFKGLVGSKPAAEQIYDVSPDLVAWGESLHKAVSESVNSMSGKLVLPPIEFEN